jgi:hypothetical protein
MLEAVFSQPFEDSIRMNFFSGRRCGLYFGAVWVIALCLLAAPTFIAAQSTTTPAPPPAPISAQPPAADDNFHYNNSLPSGPNIPLRAQLPGFGAAATQWIYPRLGATADLRLYAGLGNTNVNPYTVNSPLFVESFLSVGPEYRVVRTPAIGVSVHAMAGGGYGEFNFHVPSGVGYQQLGNYPNSGTWDMIGGGNIDFNRPNGLAVRISPNVITTDFHGDLRASFTITAGFVFRFGKF